MNYYFAPLEGITGYLYRRAHHTFYPDADRYFTPFLVPKEKKNLDAKERNDVLPEHNRGMRVVPQIMTNRPDEFLRICRVLHQEYGYQEVNLNLGCPSRTVVSKKRGSGFLSVPDRLEEFLIQVCTALESYGMRLSVKTRIGTNHPDEFFRLLEIFKKLPLSGLIVHPRLQKDFYCGVPDWQAFLSAYEACAQADWELCYNGDIFCRRDYQRLCMQFPKLPAVMMGRGLLVNPALIREIRAGESCGIPEKVRENSGTEKLAGKTAVLPRFQNASEEKAERKRRYEMYEMLLEDYRSVMCGEKNVLFKMKELWMYMSQDFTQPQRYWKKMKKAQKLSDFHHAVCALYMEQRLREWTDEPVV